MSAAASQYYPTVLLVDDDPLILTLTAKILARNQFNVTTADSVEQALGLLQTIPYDLIISDVHMPDIDGLEFLNRVKRINPSIATVIMTAHTSINLAVKAIKSGALGLVSKPFTEAELIDSVHSAMETAQLVTRSVEAQVYTPMLEMATTALLNALEAKDLDSQGHSQRVADRAADLAKTINLEPHEVTQIYFGALFHDIGKIGIPDRILRKDGLLSPEETQEMMQHPGIGARILSTVEGLEDATNIVYRHHERYDGMGYPDGLAGDEIPLGARIVAIADGYEDMISDRTYAATMTNEEAIQELIKERGQQFDPQLVDLFILKLSHELIPVPHHSANGHY